MCLNCLLGKIYSLLKAAFWNVLFTPLLEVFLAYLAVWRLKTLHFLYLESAFFVIFFVRTEVMKSFSHFAFFFFFSLPLFSPHCCIVPQHRCSNNTEHCHCRTPSFCRVRSKELLGHVVKNEILQMHWVTFLHLLSSLQTPYLQRQSSVVCEREEKEVTLEKKKTFRRDCCLYSKLLISFQDGLLLAHE